MRSHTIILIVRALERASQKLTATTPVEAPHAALCARLGDARARAEFLHAPRRSSRSCAAAQPVEFMRRAATIWCGRIYFRLLLFRSPLWSCAGLNQKVYRQSWADKGYDPTGHHYLITRIGLRNQVAFGYRCWKGKVDAAPTTIKQPTKREWKVLPEFV